jgi:hypothetical protein
MYIESAHACLLVYSFTSRQTFESIRKYHGYIVDIKERRALKQPKAVILVGNKVDLEAEREVSVRDGESLACELGAIRELWRLREETTASEAKRSPPQSDIRGEATSQRRGFIPEILGVSHQEIWKVKVIGTSCNVFSFPVYFGFSQSSRPSPGVYYILNSYRPRPPLASSWQQPPTVLMGVDVAPVEVIQCREVY